MALNARVTLGLLVVASVANADPGQTTVAVEGTYHDARNTFSLPKWDFEKNEDLRWEGVHTQFLTAFEATHARATGYSFGVRLGRIDGGPAEEKVEERRSIGVPQTASPVVIETRYVLWAPSVQLGYQTKNFGFEVGSGAVIGQAGEVSPTFGVRGLAGDLTTADGDGKVWFELSLGEVDSLPEVSQIALGVGVEGEYLRLRSGFEATNIPTYEAGDCERCGVILEADGGGFYADATIKLGDVGLRLRGVMREYPRGLIGLNYTF